MLGWGFDGDGAGSLQQCVWQAGQHPGSTMAAGIGFGAGGTTGGDAGQAHADTGNEPTAVATASSTHNAGRHWRNRTIPPSYNAKSPTVNQEYRGSIAFFHRAPAPEDTVTLRGPSVAPASPHQLADRFPFAQDRQRPLSLIVEGVLVVDS